MTENKRPLLVDLFCGAGGASSGYYQAGFDVIGVDINPQPNYPFPFIQEDAQFFMLDYLCGWLGPHFYDREVVFHASPPCQRYSKMSKCRPGLAEKYPDLIDPIRDLLQKTGKRYVIENVPGAPLVNPVELCGCQFGLGTNWPGNGHVILQRKRLFESNVDLKIAKISHNHLYPAITVAGHGPGNKSNQIGVGYVKAAREAMEISWMTRDELAEAIPPKYTLLIGKQIMEDIEEENRNDRKN